MSAHWDERELKELAARLALVAADIFRALQIEPVEKTVWDCVGEVIVTAREIEEVSFRQHYRDLLQSALRNAEKFYKDLTNRLLAFTIHQLERHDVDPVTKPVALKYVTDAMAAYFNAGRLLSDTSFSELAGAIKDAVRRDYAR